MYLHFLFPSATGCRLDSGSRYSIAISFTFAMYRLNDLLLKTVYMCLIRQSEDMYFLIDACIMFNTI